MKKLLICLLAFGLTACAVYTPRGSVVVDPDGNLQQRHCPPGQAKKGNC